MKLRVFLIALIFTAFSLIAQNSLPRGYQNIKLGMDFDQAKEELLKNSDFGYHGDRDVSLIPGNNQKLIETDADKGLGLNFLSQCWFQFYNDELYIITININPEKMDYYSLFTTLCSKYGNPTKLDPIKSTWENDEIIMILEKPLSIKYIQKSTYNDLLNYSNVEKSAVEITRQMFLDEF